MMLHTLQIDSRANLLIVDWEIIVKLPLRGRLFCVPAGVVDCP
jgi:hypothetical protein